jgi:hypothetical protein
MMKKRLIQSGAKLFLVLVSVSGIVVSPAGAQIPQGGPPPPFPFGGGRPPGPPGGGPRGSFVPETLSAATVPTAVLSVYLHLTPEQNTRIDAIIEELRQQRPRPPAPPMQNGNGDYFAPPLPPSPEEMQERRKKAVAAFADAKTRIEALMSEEQKRRLPPLMDALTALKASRISLNAAIKLALTPEQITDLAEMNNNATYAKTMALFTPDQKEVADLNQIREPFMRPGRNHP